MNIQKIQTLEFKNFIFGFMNIYFVKLWLYIKLIFKKKKKLFLMVPGQVMIFLRTLFSHLVQGISQHFSRYFFFLKKLLR